jgi:hypothetical protein
MIPIKFYCSTWIEINSSIHIAIQMYIYLCYNKSCRVFILLPQYHVLRDVTIEMMNV